MTAIILPASVRLRPSRLSLIVARKPGAANRGTMRSAMNQNSAKQTMMAAKAADRPVSPSFPSKLMNSDNSGTHRQVKASTKYAIVMPRER